MTVKEYDKIIGARLKSARYKHSKNVAKEAIRLAKKYGADPEKAEIAGLLHDITKEAEPQEHMDVIQRAEIELTEMEQSSPKLWHAISGSAYIQVELDVTDREIIDAVRYHTTGRANMTLLDKVIFVADFISADRDYDGVDKMRKVADKGLDAAVLEGMAFTIADLAQRKITIAPDTVAGYNEIAFQKSKQKNK
ncbi:MAG: bis(5'-nucleosyl)-tetraphosphatase (symmetrical) YqeK [Clostridia bacterium]|nr:bis(5'-nucleosyl)-tetraphosphatase (symmetrical) YqeK [Clostridia bacterium]